MFVAFSHLSGEGKLNKTKMKTILQKLVLPYKLILAGNFSNELFDL